MTKHQFLYNVPFSAQLYQTLSYIHIFSHGIFGSKEYAAGFGYDSAFQWNGTFAGWDSGLPIEGSVRNSGKYQMLADYTFWD